MGIDIRTSNPQITTQRFIRSWLQPDWIMQIQGWSWDISANVRVNGGSSPQMASGQGWQVGFIQNVVGVTARFRYDSGRVVSINHQQQLLDAETSTQAWVGSLGGGVFPWNAFFYQGPSKPFNFRLNFNDNPRAAYFNFFGGGGMGGDQLREVRDQTTFRLWLAARRDSAPPHDPRSYQLLEVTNDFSVTVDIRISTGVNDVFTYAFQQQFAGTGQPLPSTTTPAVSISPLRIRWGSITSHRRTTNVVVSGSLANQVLPSIFASNRVSPSQVPTLLSHEYRLP